ncbi:hypothetical protein PG995_001436 [Apiospora arundinis]|uniref:AA1-like domain-containing protein n=1 Tax=Apiospora arundinis TaxID=335852 RepID=A0ABR2J8I7_9PEZI
MLFSVALVGLLANTAASTPLKYKMPANMKIAADCTMPAEYTVDGFSVYTDSSNQTTVSFAYTDSATGINTRCERNPASKPHNTNPGLASRYACDDANVEFIYQTTGVAGLTVIEAACPGSGSSTFEASGLVPFNLTCSSASTGQNCTSNPVDITREFTSLQPRPAGAAAQ